MVPDRAPHKLFWKRYFFKVHLIELQEARRQVLKKRAEQATKEAAAESGEEDLPHNTLFIFYKRRCELLPRPVSYIFQHFP